MDAVAALIEQLNLAPHCEGGYYRRTYCSTLACTNQNNNERKTLSSIYYLITNKIGMSYFACNISDLILYYHCGDPLRIIFLDEQGHLEEKILGLDIAAGQSPQITCQGGVWKAYDLMSGHYTLVSEAVSPAYVEEDMFMPNETMLKARAPTQYPYLKSFIKP